MVPRPQHGLCQLIVRRGLERIAGLHRETAAPPLTMAAPQTMIARPYRITTAPMLHRKVARQVTTTDGLQRRTETVRMRRHKPALRATTIEAPPHRDPPARRGVIRRQPGLKEHRVHTLRRAMIIRHRHGAIPRRPVVTLRRQLLRGTTLHRAVATPRLQRRRGVTPRRPVVTLRRQLLRGTTPRRAAVTLHLQHRRGVTPRRAAVTLHLQHRQGVTLRHQLRRGAIQRQVPAIPHHQATVLEMEAAGHTEEMRIAGTTKFCQLIRRSQPPVLSGAGFFFRGVADEGTKNRWYLGVRDCTHFIGFDHQTVAIVVVARRKLFSLACVVSREDQPLNCKFAVS